MPEAVINERVEPAPRSGVGFDELLGCSFQSLKRNLNTHFDR